MGLLDNLVSDLVKSSTGLNARGFVRMVKNVSEQERTWLDRLAGALEIPPTRREVTEWDIFL